MTDNVWYDPRMEATHMNRLQLATLVSWAGQEGFQGRKRLQKVVYLLQQAGCPLGCSFTLHHYGPYSRDVADVCDEMVAAGLIEEGGGPAAGVMQYAYQLSPRTSALLSDTADEGMQRFQDLATSLINESIWPLELGATILLFHQRVGDWPKAMALACEFKKVPADIPASQNALALAKRVKQAAAA